MLQHLIPETAKRLYYVSDPQGVRYGLADAETAKALDLTRPKNAPLADR